MTVLNIPSDGLPNILLVIHHALLASAKPMEREALLDAVAPKSILTETDVRKQVSQTLRRWTDLGLFDETGGLISVAERPSSRLKGSMLTAFTRRIACQLALSEKNNPDLWAVEGARSADLTRSLAWMMAQNAYETHNTDLEALEARQIVNQDRRLLRNDTRQNGLRHWAGFLGFSRGPGGDIDPTVAIRDALPEILEPGAEMSAGDFLTHLARVLPVIDGGRWQTAVLAEVDSDALLPLQAGQLSTALSRALLCLRATGELQLLSRADVGTSMVLTGFRGLRPDLTFQWVVRPAGPAVGGRK